MRDLENYAMFLEFVLDGLEIAAEEAVCNEPAKCSHADGIQTYYYRSVAAMLQSAKRCIPKVKVENGKKIFRNDELKNLKKVAKSNYVRWRNAGNFVMICIKRYVAHRNNLIKSGNDRT